MVDPCPLPHQCGQQQVFTVTTLFVAFQSIADHGLINLTEFFGYNLTIMWYSIYFQLGNLALLSSRSIY